jgi:3' terminal RNA ribose 2'-O-methyltransferase Hen1
MLLTITTTYVPATDLGYLLHKHPARVQTFALSFGEAHVFYPEAGPERCTASLLLDIDPLQLAPKRHTPPSSDFLLQPYVNDRPYVASSFLSVAIAEVFGTALSGRCQERPALAETPLPLQARLAVLPCSGGESVLRRLFEPLCYRVTAERHPLDERTPAWGDSEYFTVTLTGTMRLCDLLSHVYVLVPVLDDEKHYWIGDDEVAKLLRYGEGWLSRHPERELIAGRYLKHQRDLTNAALAQLADDDDADRDATEPQGGDAEDRLEASIGLQHQRLEAVLAALHGRGVTRILDLGCGDGTLVRRLWHDQYITEVVGMDVSRRRLDRAAARLHLDDVPAQQRRRLTLIQGSLLYRDPPLVGYDAAVLIEVIEHLEPTRLDMFARVLFGYTRPSTVILTTPNRYTFSSPEDVATATVERQPLWSNRQHEHGPFDIIGDVHGCGDELEQLLAQLGYQWSERPLEIHGLYRRVYRHPNGRKAIFLGDLVDRGPRILDTYQLVRHMVEAGSALCVPGNHETKLVRKLRGRDVAVTHGLQQTLAEIERLPIDLREGFCRDMVGFLDGLISHYVLDDGKLVVAHAGLKASLQGRASQQVREFALYGETTGETDAYGLPVRHNWAAEYRGQARVVYGHTPVPEAEWLNRTINIDTGCVFGGKLTALRYPELAFVSVPAARIYTEPIRPFLSETADARTAQQQSDELLDLDDLLGKHAIHTRLWPTIVMREEQSTAALEVMSRFAIDPRWLIYLPPTMSPPDPSDAPDRLEDPAQVFDYYRRQGIPQVICEEKHMGSRAIVIVCHDEAATQRRFGLVDGGIGICYTRTGRRFFADQAMEDALLAHLQSALTDAGFWEAWETDGVCLDGELMPCSLKAQSLLRQQYAPVGAAGHAASTAALAALR